ncbi:metal-binding protein [Bacillus mobilis]|uniref:Peptidase n=2 Tax=Bacillus cereus group TaxID=86661 RepID=A0A1C4FG52_BACCE|nr:MULTISPECIES: metal-binding protein [Bacillus cereus group]MCC2462360.1 metal-binding protein [Bacillus mobilis]MCU5434174.1 metal-binding protein [Bacillus mobilis]MCU5594386.1 metal-binding protein [Bacillus mobilis]MCU5735338.1 metal-binding protein [Bacillus mobilis]MCU9558143.1 metal-binding protein [Bacillus mobilis]
MPSGRTHTKINLISLPVVLFMLFSYGLTNLDFLLTFAIGFLVGTSFLTPDLDTYSNAYNKWGFLRIFWYPYKKVMPHRSFFTHTIILGDVIRIAYMLIVFSPFLFLLNVIAFDGNLIEIAKKHEVEIVTFVMGIVVASTLHIIADKVNTRRKKMMRKKKKRRR